MRMQQPEPVPVEQGLGVLPVHLFINRSRSIEYELQLQGLIQEIRTCNEDPVKHLEGGLRIWKLGGKSIRIKALAPRSLIKTAADY